MSWLYSIIFAGLMFGSGTDVAVIDVEKVADGDSAVQAPSQDVTEKIDQTYPLSADGRVSLSNINGSVTVEAWDRNEVRIEATKTADSQATLNQFSININSSPTSIKISVDPPNWRYGDRDQVKSRRVRVDFKLMVPRTANLNSIDTINGSISLSEFVASTKVTAVNGNINAVNLRGNANLSTVNGMVNAEFNRVESGGTISLNTVNGSVKLLLPSDVNATIKADSLNGEITNDFGLPVKKGQFVGRNLHGRIGSGEGQIKLTSVNGPLIISRRRDGRQPGSATSLLNSGSEDVDVDFDLDMDIEADVANAALNAARVSQKEISAAMKESEKEMALARPEIEKAQQKMKEAQAKISAAEMTARMSETIARQAEAFGQMANFNWGGRVPSMRKRTNSFPVAGTPSVVVEAKGCDVSVRSWDRPEVRYVVTELGPSRSQIQVNESFAGNTLTLKAGGDAKSVPAVLGRRSEVRIEIMVPRSSKIRVETNGAVRVVGIDGDLEINGSDEPIDVRDSSGSLKLNATDAQVRILGFDGALDSTVEDGDVFLEGRFRSISSKAADGTVTLTLEPELNAEILSNTDIRNDGVNAVKNGDRGLRIGSGGPKYQFTFDGGQLLLRGVSKLESF
ncbi:MAG: DUF4097 family beta strand repeat-containing protein [Pyrinomonadaceae bacterium]|nr:DUF4097 family beta strand repeat-containing protein [Pyrinomonadaceae bacterium]